MNCGLFVIPCAYAIDLLAGDPQVEWHPVRLIGRLVRFLDIRLNKQEYNRRVAGVILVVLVSATVIFIAWTILKLSLSAHPALYFAVSVLLVYFSISTRALADEAGKVERCLKNGDIGAAREKLSMIVGRDTANMDEAQIIRATVETVAESTMDGIVAPLFYAFLGGPVLAWFYKSVNTMDSMVGHRNERYAEFGWAAARLDGLFNLVPSKITTLAISASAFLCGKDWAGSFRWAARYVFKGPSLNSDTTEASMSGGLRIRLGGRNFYGGLAVDKPLLGDGPEPLQLKHIGQSVRVCYLSSLLMMIAAEAFYIKIFS